MSGTENPDDGPARGASSRTSDLHTLHRRLTNAEEAERRRLSREVHDQLGQHIAALTLGLADTRRVAADAAAVDARLVLLEQTAWLLARDARHLALELRPPELDDVGLESALATYIEHWRARYHIDTELAITGEGVDGHVSADVSTALYRIAQEALTNIAKHAQARHVTISLDKRKGEVRLVVEDDGRGFELDGSLEQMRRDGRLGLIGMRERASVVGGVMEIESCPAKGAAVYVRVPSAGAAK